MADKEKEGKIQTVKKKEKSQTERTKIDRENDGKRETERKKENVRQTEREK